MKKLLVLALTTMAFNVSAWTQRPNVPPQNCAHLDPASPKLSLKWWEFDIGWMYLKLFCLLRLAKLTRQT